MKSNVFRDDALHVVKTKCDTCIYRPGNLMNLDEGRKDQMQADAIADQSVIVCHKTLDSKPRLNAVCRGYFDVAKHEVGLLSAAQRLDIMKEVEVNKDEDLRDWALKAPALAMKALADDMPGVREAKKPQVVEWLMQHERERLAECRRLSTRGVS